MSTVYKSVFFFFFLLIFVSKIFRQRYYFHFEKQKINRKKDGITMIVVLHPQQSFRFWYSGSKGNYAWHENEELSNSKDIGSKDDGFDTGNG